MEWGFQRDDALALAILFGVIGLVILVATLIATALSQAENAPLLGTLAAVGATRRALAGAQALYLGLLGSVLGLAPLQSRRFRWRGLTFACRQGSPACTLGLSGRT